MTATGPRETHTVEPPPDEDDWPAGIDRDLLIEAVRRSNVLAELRSGPADASELEAALDVSRSTIHRATKSLEELNLIEKSNGRFELTGVGDVVARETDVYGRRIAAAISLEPFLNLVDVEDVPIEHFADATVTVPKPRQPHFTVRRIMDLIEEADSLRLFTSVISPFYVDVAHREILEGTEVEAIFDADILDIVLAEYESEARGAIETGNFDVYVHDSVPFELFLLDGKIGMAAHDENGIARVFVEADSPEAIRWARRLYDRYLAESRHKAP
ncbi:helix-turn-helix transcriptional regulator [Salinilacihabitans rarus]|uniref:helix-turn-helix transcriptional regulator n=1 Tax=Salinilacihabitans rarus TaxID=2961596 RepID=UPI0020C8C93E|nr:MarR family transcriptional regulator [Salinilacihabitans rarus]